MPAQDGRRIPPTITAGIIPLSVLHRPPLQVPVPLVTVEPPVPPLPGLAPAAALHPPPVLRPHPVWALLLCLRPGSERELPLQRLLRREIRSWRLGCAGSGGAEGRRSGHVVAVCRSAVKSLVVSGDRLFSAHQDHRIHVWRISQCRERYKLAATLPTAGDRLLSLLSPESYVVVRRHKKCTWVHHADAVSAVALSCDGDLLYSASWDRSFKVWRTSDGKCLESVANAHHDAINAVAASKDGFVYTGSADTTVKVWRRRPGEKKHSLAGTLEQHRSAVNALALSPDGSVLYSGACDRSVVVWEGGGGGGGGAENSSAPHMVVAGALRGHTKAVLCLETVGELVCSGSEDRSVRVWRRGVDRSYSCLAVLEGHRGPVKCLAAAADQEEEADACGGVYRTIYTGSLDRDVKVWRVYVPLLQQFAE